jgi:tRNA (mo5U34)-methyltransferase
VTLQSKTHDDADLAALAPWFHNLHLPDGRETAPDHPLGDFPRVKWEQIAPHIPRDLAGRTALDIGCNAGFYSFELARRGAAVVGIDADEHYLAQARWAARAFGLASRTQFERMQVYELARTDGVFDVVLFMGVLYHLRHPLLALDAVAGRVGQLLVFQTLTMPGDDVAVAQPDMSLGDRVRMLEDGWPKLAFIEHALEQDETNWWAPNHAAVEAMVRSTGLEVVARPGHEIYVCRRAAAYDSIRARVDAELQVAAGV